MVLLSRIVLHWPVFQESAEAGILARSSPEWLLTESPWRTLESASCFPHSKVLLDMLDKRHTDLEHSPSAGKQAAGSTIGWAPELGWMTNRWH